MPKLVPPEGYVSLSVVADAAGLSMDTMYEHARAQSISTLTGKHSAIFVAKSDVEPFVLKFGKKKRQRASLGRSREKIEWTPSMDALLGKSPDMSVAESLKISQASVRGRRVFLGIPSYQHQPPDFVWELEHLAMLGKRPDSEIAQAIGAHPQAVKRKRVALGVSAYVSIAKKPKKPRLHDYQHLLGKHTDVEIAKQFHLTTQTIGNARRKLGIKPAGTEYPKFQASFQLEENEIRSLKQACKTHFKNKGIPAIELTDKQLLDVMAAFCLEQWGRSQ